MDHFRPSEAVPENVKPQLRESGISSMAATIPYTYFQCPCTSLPSAPLRRVGESVQLGEEGEAEDERDFDPRAPRSNYSLYPLEYLLYCEDCQQIRCPRCVLDEIVTWYCPNCLFEVPSSTVKSEGNRYWMCRQLYTRSLIKTHRCTRNCFQCPICISPLSINPLEPPQPLPAGSLLGPEEAAQSIRWVLSCSHCNWSSKDIGIKFERPNGIYSQLSRIGNGGVAIVPPKGQERRDREEGRGVIGTPIIAEEEEDGSKVQAEIGLDSETWFSNLRSFYQSQLAETSSVSSLNFSGEYGFGSPGTLSRIMGLYTGSSYSDKKSKKKTGLMREAYDVAEGLHLCPPSDPAVKQLKEEGWAGTTSQEQRSYQSENPRFISELRPVPYLLRTKRSKRCKTCRHILSKPEAKVQATRFRIRLVALNYIPTITISPLSSQSQPAGSPAQLLTPLKPTQFLLTLKNPLFDPVKITLATPSHTPGRLSSKITILCPQFEVGANIDVWDEAIQDGGDREKRRTTREVGEGQGQAEAGKIWEKGRNWVSVVVEVVPASLQVERGLAVLRKGLNSVDVGNEEREIAEDEDILEIPLFVRVEWEADSANDETGGGVAKEKELKEKRELAYWCVLSVGRIAQT